jgi:two-component system LytT family response regulator
MKKIIIIDDEPLARAIVVEYLQQYKDIEIVAECKDGFEGVKKITEHNPDLIFLDIQMPKINGFEMLELIPNVQSVIFTTAFDEYAIKAFENNAIDYLLKPFSPDRFEMAFNKWRSKTESLKSSENELQHFIENDIAHQPEEKNRIVVKKGNDIRIIPVSDIFYLEAYDDYVKIYTKDDCYLKKKTMNYYEQVLDNTIFFRTHRSFIINLSQLTKIELAEKNNYAAVLKNGKKISISRSNYSKLKELLGI